MKCVNKKERMRSKLLVLTDLPADYVPPEEVPETKPTERPEKKTSKIFSRRADSKTKPTLNRQTSQACSVM